MKVFRFFINNNLISEKFLKAQRCILLYKKLSKTKKIKILLIIQLILKLIFLLS